MTTYCVDPTDSNTINAGLLRGNDSQHTPSIVTPSGFFNSRALDTFTAEFEANVVARATTDTELTSAITSFGEDAFYQAVGTVNQLVYAHDFVLPEGYTGLESRLSTSVLITPLETAQFMQEYNYDPVSLRTTIQSNRSKVLFDMNFFYTASFAGSKMGSFCSIMPTIFGAVDAFFTSMNDIASFISKIQSVSLAGLIQTLSAGILGVVDAAIQAVKSAVENFSLNNILGRSEAFIQEGVLKKTAKLKEDALSFFSTENIEALKARIKSSIDYVLSIFKNPSLEEIQYIVYRFCGLAMQLEGAIQQVQKPLTDYGTEYASVYKTLAVSSKQNTVRAVSAGALRYDLSTRQTNINSSREAHTAAGNPAPLVVGEADGITSWNEGKGDSRIGFGPGLQRGAMGEEGWTRVDIKARAILMRVQARFGRKLQVNSGYRSPAYNSRVGGASRSFHMQGLAIDVSWSGFNSATREEFIRIAREEGFRGIGRYNSFVHVDLGGRVAQWSG